MQVKCKNCNQKHDKPLTLLQAIETGNYNLDNALYFRFCPTCKSDYLKNISWKFKENRKLSESFKLHKLLKKNPDFDYITPIMKISEDDLFLAAKIAGFLNGSNKQLKEKILTKAIQDIKDTQKGMKFIWASHVLEFYNRLDLFADVLTIKECDLKELKTMHHLKNDKSVSMFYTFLINYAGDWETSCTLYQIAILNRSLFITKTLLTALANKATYSKDKKAVLLDIERHNL